MGLIKKLLGTPPEHKEEKKKHEVVKAPEFDVTQYAKKLGVTIGVIAAATATALKLFKVEQITDVIVVGALGVTAAALLGVSFVMATDLAARAYLSGEGSAPKEGENEEENGDATTGDGDTPSGGTIAAPAGTQVWLEGGSDPHPVLAMSGDGEKISSFLVATGSTVERTADEKQVKALDGTVKWYSADEIRAIKPAAWP